MCGARTLCFGVLARAAGRAAARLSRACTFLRALFLPSAPLPCMPRSLPLCVHSPARAWTAAREGHLVSAECTGDIQIRSFMHEVLVGVRAFRCVCVHVYASFCVRVCVWVLACRTLSLSLARARSLCVSSVSLCRISMPASVRLCHLPVCTRVECLSLPNLGMSSLCQSLRACVRVCVLSHVRSLWLWPCLLSLSLSLSLCVCVCARACACRRRMS